MKLRLWNIEQELKKVMTRFPNSCLAILFVSVMFFLLPRNSWWIYEEQMAKAALAGIVCFFLSTGLTLFLESQKDFKSKHSKVLHLFPFIFSIGFYYFLSIWGNSFELFVRFFLTLTGVGSFLFFAPYISKLRKSASENTAYYSYFYSVSTAIFTALITWLSTFVLWAIGIAAVDVLFDLSWSILDNIYWDVAIFSLAVLAPLFGLSKLPQMETFYEDSYNESIFFSFLLKYIALPFISLYFLILYAYTVKVLLNFSDWPRGEVSWMVIGFSLFGYLTYVLSYVFETWYRYIKSFRKVFPYAVLAQTWMLFYAIYLRIVQYDFTVNRYFVVTFGVFLVVVSLYLIFSKYKRLVVIPLILCLFTVIFSLWPWSVYALPESRQLSRLKENLIEANILQWDIIVPLENISDIDAQLSWEIYAGIQYLCALNNCESIERLFPEQYQQVLNQKYDLTASYPLDTNFDLTSWETISWITEILNVERYVRNSNYDDSYHSVNMNLTYYDTHFPMDTTGYTTVSELTYNTIAYQKMNTLNARIDTRNQQLVVEKWEEVLETLSMSDIFSTLKNINSPVSDPEKMVFELQGARYDVKIFLDSIRFPLEEVGESEYYRGHANGYVLLREK